MNRARAVRFGGELPEGGRSRPLLIEVETDDFGYLDMVVKLASASATLDGRRLVRESVSAALAVRLGLPVPPCLVVELSEPFIASVELEDASIGFRIREHVRMAGTCAFGSTYCPAHEIVIPRWTIPESLRQLATEIFSFDALTLNRDRCIPSVGNPNCLTNGLELLMIDHEQALDSEFIGEDESQAPWTPGALDEMCGLLEHIFYYSLKGGTHDYSRIKAAWEGVSADEREDFFAGVPLDWDLDRSERRAILGYLRQLHANLPAAFAEVGRVLT